MALRVSSIASLPRVHNGIARSWPIATTLAAVIFTVVPLHAPGYAALAPAFALMAVYHWTIYRPDLLPPIGLFAAGLAQDFLTGGNVGVNALVFLLARAIVLRHRRYFINCGFAFVWAGFTLLSAGLIFGLWLMQCLMAWHLLDLRGPIFQAVLTIAIFPVGSFVLGRTQRALIGTAA
jgi:rod shape-determining protein MreD